LLRPGTGALRFSSKARTSSGKLPINLEAGTDDFATLIPKKNFCVHAPRFNGEQTRSRKQMEFSTANHAEYANKDWIAPLALIIL
jgi:hypothetical protein